MQFTFDSNIPCGNGMNFQVKKENTVQFEIREDTGSDDKQWFHFKVAGAAGKNLTFRLINTDKTNIPCFWNANWPVISTDQGKTWKHINAPGVHQYSSGVFEFSVEISNDEVLLASHFPYGVKELESDIKRWGEDSRVTVSELGKSLEGRPISLLTLSDLPKNSKPRKAIWLTSRQHAAESPASFALQGAIDELLLGAEASQDYLKDAIVFVVPMINPDGVEAGNYRDNALGQNLNRFWNAPTEETPEVALVTKAVDEWVSEGNPFDLFIDFHADSSAHEHYLFHYGGPARATAESEEYQRRVARFLRKAASECPFILNGKGKVVEFSPGISYHYMREKYGVLSFIPEGGYNQVTFGRKSGTYLDPEAHRSVGRGLVRAFVDLI